jgi:hypothetical protein
VASLRKAGAPAQPYLAEGLEMLGALQLAQHRSDAGIGPLTEAVHLRERTGSQSWELAHARELLGEALQASGRTKEARDVLQLAIDLLQEQLGPEHPETIRVRQALSGKAT